MFYACLSIVVGYSMLIFVVPSILIRIRLERWIEKVYSGAGLFSLMFLLIGTIPAYQIIVYQFLCSSSNEYYSEDTCTGSGAVTRTILALILLCLTVGLCWLLSSCLKTSNQFDKSYLNSPQNQRYMDYIVWPLIATLLHMTGNPIARVVNIFVIALGSLYSIGYDIWEISTFDESMRKFYFRIKVVFGWVYISVPLLYVSCSYSGVRR